MYYNESDRTQPTRRRNYNVLDQWGRKWLVSVEKETGHTCGAIEPCFQDPLSTPMKYLTIHEEMPRELVIRYDQWIADQNQAMLEWEARRDDIGRALYGERYNPSKKVTRELERIVGKQPRPASVIEKAAAGDRALLGLAPEAVTVSKPAQGDPKPKIKRKASPLQLAALARGREARKATSTKE